MKRLVMAVAALVCCATIGFAQGKIVEKEPFVANFNKLSSYLELSPSQVHNVGGINEYFIEKQTDLMDRNPVIREYKMRQAVYENLKLMKNELTDQQYRKYVTLLNVTNNNNRLSGGVELVDVYLADNK